MQIIRITLMKPPSHIHHGYQVRCPKLVQILPQSYPQAVKATSDRLRVVMAGFQIKKSRYRCTGIKVRESYFFPKIPEEEKNRTSKRIRKMANSISTIIYAYSLPTSLVIDFIDDFVCTENQTGFIL